MKSLDGDAVAPSPRWDGNRILFDVNDGGQSIACAISRAALEELIATRCFGAADMLRGFVGARDRIERLALAKSRARPDGNMGRLTLWADDIDDAQDMGGHHAA
jgi:Protein of unknown function (DUF1488)